MEIFEVTAKEYSQVIGEKLHAFQFAEFNELNRNKCDNVLYFLFKDTKCRLGLVAGVIDSVIYSPFSAPFGGFASVTSNIKLIYIEDSIKVLKEWAKKNKINFINITLPPDFYNQTFISKQINCLWREGFKVLTIDLNYEFHLDFFDNNYSKNIQYNARKNLKIGLNSNLHFAVCDSDNDKKLAYEIIKRNRNERGFPLRMSWEHVRDTIKIIDADFFLVKDQSDNFIASAIVFHVNPKKVQVIYWGDIHEYSNMRTMNYLSYKVFEYYKNIDFEIVDIGPSTEDSKPNHGLAEFKESIGCTVTPKYKFTYNVI